MQQHKVINLSADVHWVGVNDAETPLFEGLWNIPEGVSYNSYLVVGSEKTALIDSVHEKNSAEHFAKIEELKDLADVDYLVINHMEPDHTGSIPLLLKKTTKARVVLTPIAQNMLRKFYGVQPQTLLVKEEGLQVSLGNKTLQFIQTPWLHWPETMSTYLVEDKILFSCDTFGSFRKLPQNALFESDVGSKEQHVNDSRKYFASVFNGQREWVLKAIDKFNRLNLEINVLAPSHGPVYTANAKEMMKLWGSWSQGHYKKTVVIAYGSMYGITKKAIESISNGVTEAGGSVVMFNLSEEFPINALSVLVEAPALIIGSPTYEHEMFPKVKDFLNLLSTKKFSSRVAGAFGSFGWSGEAMRKVSAELTGLGFEMAAEPLAVFGSPTKEDLEKAKQLGRMVAEKAFTRLNSINV